jgi:chromosome partitioning protein
VPVIAVVNRKGGSGKSTLATHVAVWLSRRGEKVMLGDVDRQRSTVPWLRRRSEQLVAGEPVQGWVSDPRNILRPPAGVRHVVLDTPGGLHGFDLGRVAMYADILLLPLADSLFDRESAAGCLEELRAHPRVASGRVQVGVVGMRLEWTGFAEGQLREWAAALSIPMVATVRESRAYVSAAERGLTVLDLPEEQTPTERTDLGRLFDWIDGAIAAIPLPVVTRPAQSRITRDAAAPAATDTVPESLAAQATVPVPAPQANAAAPARSTWAAPTPGPDAGRVPDAGIPISLIRIDSRPAGTLTQLRRWIGRMLPGHEDR